MLLDYLSRNKKKETIDWDSFTVSGERENDVDGYIRHMCGNGRI